MKNILILSLFLLITKLNYSQEVDTIQVIIESEEFSTYMYMSNQLNEKIVEIVDNTREYEKQKFLNEFPEIQEEFDQNSSLSTESEQKLKELINLDSMDYYLSDINVALSNLMGISILNNLDTEKAISFIEHAINRYNYSNSNKPFRSLESEYDKCESDYRNCLYLTQIATVLTGASCARFLALGPVITITCGVIVVGGGAYEMYQCNEDFKDCSNEHDCDDSGESEND